MTVRSITAVAAASLILAASAHAQDLPKPSPEMSKLSGFVGTWMCEGKMNPSPLGPAGTMKSTAEIKSDLGGFWQSGVIKGTMDKMPPFEGRFHTTYDQANKQFVMLWVDNMGGWSQSTSSGWKGESIIYQGESHMGPQKFMGRDTFTRNADGSLKHSWEAQLEGKWVALGEETCKKK